MKLSSSLLCATTLQLAGIVIAAPAPASSGTASGPPAAGPSLTADMIKAIAPGSASCRKDEPDARSAGQAVGFIAKSMQDNGVTDPREVAAVLSLMAFESGDFRYKRNVFPGRPGQGTANMQMANFNLLYAQSLPAVRDQVADVKTTDGLPADKLNAILDLVTPDEYNFGSGPWFLTTQCAPDVREKLRADIDTGFAAYMKCVGVEVTDDRKQYLTRAKKAFGLE
ncbi:hypothetical protein IF1G_08269 [Cordyceps javanica]|uniref:Uncharacterized protein n=1 Tax=Cordyceps javanica TaxID=43265 RepID=A0A545UU24_9HYPO|nr:hypothetical protein IF1G_08269 [Cordyceps javanica]TQW04863.1 hypothetical protein IF2G_07506 [Cordyceps javanica]